jgi:hypothetical protein
LALPFVAPNSLSAPIPGSIGSGDRKPTSRVPTTIGVIQFDSEFLRPASREEQPISASHSRPQPQLRSVDGGSQSDADLLEISETTNKLAK